MMKRLLPLAAAAAVAVPIATVDHASAWSTVSADACRALGGVYVNNHCPGGDPARQAACRVKLIYGDGVYRNEAVLICYFLSHGGYSS